jgi:hypothetical protein
VGTGLSRVGPLGGFTMNRRKFLSASATTGGLLLLGGGFWARYAYARSRLRHELVRLSAPVLAAKAQRELLTLPARAREEMRRYFHGVCLNVHGFVQEVCSPEFADRLADCTSREQQRQLVLLAFLREVTTEAQVLNRVQVIAEDVGTDLDRNWAACCTELANRWDASLKEYRVAVTATELPDRMAPLLEAGLRQAVEEARAAGCRPVLSEAVTRVAESALLLLPLSAEEPWLGWPLFAVLALRPVFDDFISRVRDRSADLQWAVSDKLAQLGNRMGSEFEAEVRSRITDLHRWQDQAVDGAADRQAAQLVRLL